MLGKKYSLDAIREDWRLLDDESFSCSGEVRLISHEKFTCATELKVEYINSGKLAKLFSRIPVLYWLIYATRLFRLADSKSVVIVNGGVTHLWLWCGVLNAFPIFGKRKLFCWDLFVEYILGREKRLWFFPFIKITTQKKERLARFILRQYGLNVLWSQKQVATHAKHFNLPVHHFIFLPFKANHSKRETFNIPMGNFVFAGGNGKRDYKCLIDAVRDIGIPVIISATDPDVRKKIEGLPNVWWSVHRSLLLANFRLLHGWL